MIETHLSKKKKKFHSANQLFALILLSDNTLIHQHVFGTTEHQYQQDLFPRGSFWVTASSAAAAAAAVAKREPWCYTTQSPQCAAQLLLFLHTLEAATQLGSFSHVPPTQTESQKMQLSSVPRYMC